MEASPRYKIRPLLTRHPRKNCFPRSFSLQEIFRLENRRFLFSLQQPETGADGQALRHFVLLYFCAIISSAGGVLSRVLLNFFSFEDLHEGFSPRSTRYNPPAARWPGLPFISNSSSIFGSPVCRSRQTAELFLHGRSFFRSAENKAPLLRALHRPQRAWFLPPAPTVGLPPHFPCPGRLAPLISCDVSCCPTRFEISTRIYLGMMPPLQPPPRR